MTPNPESALNEAAGKLLLEDYEAFCQRAALLTRIHAKPKSTPSVPKPVRSKVGDQENPETSLNQGVPTTAGLSRKTVPPPADSLAETRRKLRRL